MRRKRFILISIFLFGFVTFKLHAQSIYLWENDGTQRAFSLNKIEKIFFHSSDLIIKKEGGILEKYDFNIIHNLNFINSKTETDISIPVFDSRNIHLFPNPACNILKIRFRQSIQSTSIVEILSLEGKLLHLQHIEMSDNGLNIDISNLPNGIYLCKLKSQEKIEIVKFLKQ